MRSGEAGRIKRSGSETTSGGVGRRTAEAADWDCRQLIYSSERQRRRRRPVPEEDVVTSCQETESKLDTWSRRVVARRRVSLREEAAEDVVGAPIRVGPAGDDEDCHCSRRPRRRPHEEGESEKSTNTTLPICGPLPLDNGGDTYRPPEGDRLDFGTPTGLGGGKQLTRRRRRKVHHRKVFTREKLLLALLLLLEAVTGRSAPSPFHRDDGGGGGSGEDFIAISGFFGSSPKVDLTGGPADEMLADSPYPDEVLRNMDRRCEID